MRGALLALLFAVALAGIAQARGNTDGALWAEMVREMASPLIDGGIVPGLVVGIHDGGRTEVYGFGHTGGPDSPVPDGKTIFEIGSVSKVFTSLLLADAVQRGEVALDAPLSRFLPEGVAPPTHEGTEITLQHLATHRSGLPRIPANMATAETANPYEGYAAPALFAFLDGFRLLSAPGDSYAYSNLGMGLLGEILSRNAGLTYPDLLTRVTGPLQMTDTVVDLDAARKERLAQPHSDGQPVSPWTFGALCGCGGVRSTVDDLLVFVAAHLDPASTPLAEAITLVSTRRTQEMGLGWHIARDGVTLFHNGQTGGFSSGVFLVPSLGKGVVVLSNGASTKVDQLAERLVQRMFGLQVAPPEVRTPVALEAADLARLVGTYPSPYGFVIEITLEDGQLLAQLTNQAAIRVYPASPTRFFYRAVEAELEFEIEEGGERAGAVTLHQNGMALRCVRQGG